MHRVRQVVRAIVLVAVVVTALQATAADVIAFHSDSSNSTEGIGSFEGTLSYDAVLAELRITLTNTSDPDNGGYITAFAFNIASADDTAHATLRTENPYEPTHPFVNLTGNGLRAPPFSPPQQRYDAGAGLHGQWLGGGSPVEGIAVGDSGVFYFDVIASDSDQLRARDFLSGGPFRHNFVVRMRGFEDGGSDKIPVSVIPLPPAAWMGLAGLALVVARRRKV